MGMTATTRAVPLQRLAAAVPDARLVGAGQTAVSGIGCDSRLVKPGSLFAALCGGDADGHDFVAEAARRGASALLVERAVETNLPYIRRRIAAARLPPSLPSFMGTPPRDRRHRHYRHRRQDNHVVSGRPHSPLGRPGHGHDRDRCHPHRRSGSAARGTADDA